MTWIDNTRAAQDTARARCDWAELARINAENLVSFPAVPPESSIGLAAVTYAVLALRDTITEQGESLRDTITEQGESLRDALTERGESLDGILDSGLSGIADRVDTAGDYVLDIAGTLDRPGAWSRIIRRAFRRPRPAGPAPGAPVPGGSGSVTTSYLVYYVPAVSTNTGAEPGRWVLQCEADYPAGTVPAPAATLRQPLDASPLELSLWASTELRCHVRLYRADRPTFAPWPVYEVRPVSTGAHLVPDEDEEDVSDVF